MLEAGLSVEEVMEQTDHLSKASLKPYLDDLDSSREKVAAAIGRGKKRPLPVEEQENQENGARKLLKQNEPALTVQMPPNAGFPAHLFSSQTGIVINTVNVYYGAAPSSSL